MYSNNYQIPEYINVTIYGMYNEYINVTIYGMYNVYTEGEVIG